jgi:hypothetical protein
MKRQPSRARRLAGKRTSTSEPRLWTPVADMHLHEYYAGVALIGVLASQAAEPDASYVRRWAWRLGCDMADEAARLRRRLRKGPA